MPQKKNGFILISTILLLGLTSILILSGANELIQHTKIVANQKDYIQCFYAADGALMRFRKTLATSPDFDIPSQVINTADSRLIVTRAGNKLSVNGDCKDGNRPLVLEVSDINFEEVSPIWTMP